MRTRSAAAVLTILVAASTLLAFPLLAQTTGNIVGKISDERGAPLPGVLVTIKSPALQGSRSVATDASGGFRFPGVPPGTYVVAASLPVVASVERTDVRVALSETRSLNITLAGRLPEKAVVADTEPAVDTASTTGGTSYEGTLIAKLPVVTYYYTDVVRLQPGVQQDNGDTQGRSLALSVYGSTSAENVFLIDGVNTTNVIKGIQGKAINYTFLDGVEVKTDGYQAEYGRNTGSVINALTRQGGNEFHGGALGVYGNASMRAERRRDITPPYTQEGDVQASALNPTKTEYIAGATVGGFLLKDRVWFFGAYDKLKIDQTTMPLSGIRAGEEFPQINDFDLYSGKLTFRVTPSTDLNASIFADPQTNSGSLLDVPLSTNPASYEGVRKIGGQDYSVRASQLLGRWGQATLQYGHHADRYRTSVADVPKVTDNTARIISGALSTVYGGWGSVPGTTQNNESRRDGYGGKVSFFLGSHELKAGGDYEYEATKGESYMSGGQALSIFPCLNRNNFRCDLTKAQVVPTAAGTIPVFYAHGYRTAGADPTPVKSVSFSVPSRRWSAFLQDEWRIMPNLVVNAGLRYDDQKVYMGNGQVAFDLKNQWSPRLGVSWDFLNDGSAKLYGSYGRFYYAMPTDMSIALFTTYTTVGTYNYSATSLDQDPLAPRKMVVQIGSYDGILIDPGLKAPYQDAFVIGIEKALDPTLVAGARFVYRSLGRAIEDRWDIDPSDPATRGLSGALFNPGGSGPAASGQYRSCDHSESPFDPNAGKCGLPGVAIGPATRYYRGIELMARKRVGDSLWAQASYVYSSLKGNYSGAVMTTTGQTDPGINTDFDYYQLRDNADGKLELDRPHSFRLDAAYTAPFGLQASLGFWVRSGVPINNYGYFSQGYFYALFLGPRGSLGRTPTEWDADLALGYDFRLGPVTVTPLVYFLSVFNNQIATGYNTLFNPYASFVTDPKSPFYGQAGVQPGTAANCPATAPAPCSDYSDYMKTTSRSNPRVLRVGLKVAF